MSKRANSISGAFSPGRGKRSRNSEGSSTESGASPTAIDNLQATGTPVRKSSGDNKENATFSSLLSPKAAEAEEHRSDYVETNRNRPSSQKDRKYSKSSVFNDPIHGNMNMDGLCLRIIDTQEFQRLRELKQLGTCNYVFPGATHTRFEHSIGVAHYAETVAQILCKEQPYLNITETDILCVKVAGLCHDLGHGPFSHVFDGVFMTRMRPDSKWRHEDGSVQMMKYLLKKNKIRLSTYGLSEVDILFIEEIIGGVTEASRRGRGPEKFFLYDIVNNSRNGLDVDKLDYFQRDIKYSNASSSNTSNFDRFIKLGRVYQAEPILDPKTGLPANANIPIANSQSSYFDNSDYVMGSSPGGGGGGGGGGVGGHKEAGKHYMICFPEKMTREAVDVFAVRFRLHQTIYTHKSVKKVEYMITDALEKADPFIRIPGSKNSRHPDALYRMSECIEDPCALSNLTDQVLFMIKNSRDPNLKPAQDILLRVNNRKFYRCMGKSVYKRGSQLDSRSTAEICADLLRVSNTIVEQIDGDTYSSGSSGGGVSKGGGGGKGGLMVVKEHAGESGLNFGTEEEDVDDENGDDDTDAVPPYGSSAASHCDYPQSHHHYEKQQQQGLLLHEEEEDFFCGVQSQDSCTAYKLGRTNTADVSVGGCFDHTSGEQSQGQQDQQQQQCAESGAASSIATTCEPLVPDDIIVEKMNIHYGMKQFNPVANMRFFPKDADPTSYIARHANEQTYETLLPRNFQELAVRVFCRTPAKERLARRAFELYCQELQAPCPFPSFSQQKQQQQQHVNKKYQREMQHRDKGFGIPFASTADSLMSRVRAYSGPFPAGASAATSSAIAMDSSETDLFAAII